VPILVVHGAEDRSTPLASAQRLQEAFARAGKTNLELRIQAGGHDPSGKVIQETLKWVVEHSRKVDGFRRFSGLCA
jgi:predicted esterase